MSEQPSKSGLIASGVLHGALLAFIIVGFASTPKYDDASESLPVTTVTQTQFNEIMNGERDAQPMKEPPPEPSHAAAAPPAPTPPPPPTPPTPPPETKAAEETPPPPPEPAPPPPPAKPEPPPPAPPPRPLADDAPPTPPPPPKPAPETPPTPPPAPPTKPVAEAKPAPPVRPKTPPPEKPPEKFKPDQVAKLLEKVKPDEAKPQKNYDPNAIAKLIGQNSSKATLETASVATPQGLPTQHAARMSPSLSAALDAWLTEAYLNCWTPPPTMPEGDRYVAQVRVTFNANGTLATEPTLVNPPTDPAWRPHAESAVRAVLKCNPLHVPPEFLPYFEQWRTKTVHFDPQSALG